MITEEGDLKDYKLKPMRCELNYLNKSDGSAILSQGEHFLSYIIWFYFT